MMVSKRTFLFQGLILSFHGKFQGMTWRERKCSLGNRLMFFFAVTELSGHGVRSSRLTFNQGFHMSDFFACISWQYTTTKNGKNDNKTRTLPNTWWSFLIDHGPWHGDHLDPEKLHIFSASVNFGWIGHFSEIQIRVSWSNRRRDKYSSTELSEKR